MNVDGSTVAPNGLIRRRAVPVRLSTSKTVPPAPGTYRTSSVIADWNSPSKVPGSGFQSDVKVHRGTRWPPYHRSARWVHTCWLMEANPHGAGWPEPGGSHEVYVPALRRTNTLPSPSSRGAG